MVTALRHFQGYLEGRHFKLFTDSQALTHLLDLSQPKGRLTRWISDVQKFTCDVTQQLGKKLPDADALSRLHIPKETLEGGINHLNIGTKDMELKNE